MGRGSVDDLYHKTLHVIWLLLLLSLNISPFRITMAFVGGSPVAEGPSGQYPKSSPSLRTTHREIPHDRAAGISFPHSSLWKFVTISRTCSSSSRKCCLQISHQSTQRSIAIKWYLKTTLSINRAMIEFTRTSQYVAYKPVWISIRFPI